MVRSTGWASRIALAGLALGGHAQAQSVHKCIVNGAAVYQAAACPPANEQKSLVIPAPPSQQELLDATANGRLQSVRPGADTPVATRSRRYERNQALLVELTPSQQEPEAAASSNCDQLNQAYHDAQYRHDELSAPGSGATRAAALQRANDDMKRAQDMAANTHCHLR